MTASKLGPQLLADAEKEGFIVYDSTRRDTVQLWRWVAVWRNRVEDLRSENRPFVVVILLAFGALVVGVHRELRPVIKVVPRADAGRVARRLVQDLTAEGLS